MDALPAAEAALDGRLEEISAVVAATFSNEVRFPSLAVKVSSALGLPSSIPAFDLQMACSAYPYALMAAGQLSAASGAKVLVVDGDVQSRFASDASTLPVTSDACTATVVSAGEGVSHFAFYSSYGEELRCADRMEMDGFGVFSFVATKVRSMIKGLLDDSGTMPDFFVPHQANMYMVRQLAKSLGLSGRLLACGEKYGNTGSSSGFGAGLSAAAGFVRMDENFTAIEF